MLGLVYSPSASRNASLTFRIKVLTYGTMCLSVAVSNGTFLVGGTGCKVERGSLVLFRFCKASITDRALASESLRGRVMEVLGFSGVRCVIGSDGVVKADGFGPKIL